MEAAHAKLVDGESAVAGKDWESGIASFNAGLSIDGLDDEDLKASLQFELETAEASKAARDAAREAAEAHLAEGIRKLSSREYGDNHRAGLVTSGEREYSEWRSIVQRRLEYLYGGRW